MEKIKTKTKKYISHPFFSGSLIMIVGSNIANVFAYVYHIIFGRLLPKSDYGDLAAYLAIIGMLGAMLTFIGLVIVKFVSSTKDEELPLLMKWFFYRTFIVVCLISALILLFSNNLASILNMDRQMIFLVAPTFVIMSISFLFRAYLQGLMKFIQIVIVTNVNLVGRIIFGLLLVYLGMSAFGASIGVLSATALAAIMYWFMLRKFSFFSSKGKITIGKDILQYSIPIFAASFCSTFLLSVDILMVKHFFSPEEAGNYAAVSVLGKIIFYATAPVASVMFPMISSRFSQKKAYMPIFILSLLFTFTAGVGITIGYRFLPWLAIVPLYGKRFLSISPYLWWYALYITVFAIVNLIINFYQSIERPKIGYLMVLTTTVQFLAIYIFHSSIIELIQAMIVVMGAAAIVLIFYLKRDMRISLVNSNYDVKKK